ncbi:ABC-F family ATP-binding cassette domain-containing protein [Eubacterium coprostanoligenes]|uniref:ABC-F family ATP-binding cassette domain-containing protein n=1 Tax=Eubacterium coprostanoligenes TaxID=290054 RepID=UPI002352ED02|nr:ABC-F family ATP-binding cassette domain-containing protein [Eubacterium coprostanoligenes]MCI6254921.1 ATP-binding cassette domain-containing protein [Eubacterium coprostanoligenes]MDY5400216.1 ABC-F family ATP-binding cassette domain-containing protein [Eubacterium coprostanoligenes]
MAVLDVQNLTLSFGEKTLFSNVSFDIKEKEKVGLIGCNGAGKTSLFKIITGEYTPDDGACFISKNSRLGYMEQHTCSENKTVWDELVSVFDELAVIEKRLEEITVLLTNGEGNQAELIEEQDRLNTIFTRDGGLTYKSMTRSALIGLGFGEDDFAMPTAKLSGGQRSKLILAKLLLSKADFLLLDEPTNHLDIKAVEWLEGFLKDFNGACLIVSHDRYFLDKITTKTVEIENKKCRSYIGNYSEFLVKKAAEQKAIEEKYENDMKEIARLEGIIEQQRQWNREKNIKTAESKEKVVERIKAQLVVPDSKVARIRFDFTPKCVSGDDVLSVSNLKKSFGDKTIFSNTSFEVKKGERVFLLGDNGCGKTTLLKVLMKDYAPDDGTFKFGSNVLTGYFDQVQAKLDLTKTAIEEVWSSFPSMSETSVRSALAAFLFKGDEVYKNLSDCSGGERARIALLKLMLGKFNFLLLDEPTNHLDAFSREELENTLLDYSGTMLIVSHDRYFINKLSSRILELTPTGVNEYFGNYDEYIERKNRTASQEVVEKKETVKKVNDYLLKKERRSQMLKMKNRLAKVEEEIEKTELEIDDINSKLTTSDYEELMELTAKLDRKTQYRDILYTEWEELSERLTEAEE